MHSSTPELNVNRVAKTEQMPLLIESCIGPLPGAPNPSIEGTSTSKLRLLAAAPHVKR